MPRDQNPDWLDEWIGRADQGEKDPDGFEVAKIVARSKEHRYLLYLTVDGDLRVNSEAPMAAEVIRGITAVANETDGDIALIGKFNARRGHALHLALRGETDASVAALRQLAKDISAFRRNRASQPYFLGALAMLAFVLVVTGVIRAWCWTDMAILWRQIVCIAALGSLGGTLSCVVGLRAIKTTAPLGRDAAIAGGLRTVVGMLLGGAAVTLMNADLALTFLKKLDLYGIGAAALLAGFSERWVPDAMKEAPNRIS